MLWIRSSFTAAAVVALFTAAPACSKKQVGGSVNCEVQSREAVVCEVSETKGTDEIEVCWDFQIECGNGTIMNAPRSCQKVKDGGTEKMNIPTAQMTNVDKCGGPAPKATVSNLTINGKAVK